MFTPFAQLSKQEENVTSVSRLAPLGSVGRTSDGRIYRYAQAGAVALNAGQAVSTPAKVANHTNIAVAAAVAVGSLSVTATLGATAATQDQYLEGYLVVNDAAGVGSAYRIQGNSATASAGVITVTLVDPIVTALTTSSKVSLVVNPWSNVVVNPSAAAGALFTAGVPQLAVPAASYAWIQTGGVASVLSDGIVAKAAGAIASPTVNGALVTEAAATVTQRVAVAIEATVDTKYYPMFLTIE
jgi:hypothetical protein